MITFAQRHLLPCTIVWLLCVTAGAATPSGRVTLAWDASPSSDVVGYRLFQGVQSGHYTNVVDVGNVLTATLTNLPSGLTNYFNATAYTGLGMESEFADEISYFAAVGGRTTNVILTIQFAEDLAGPWTPVAMCAVPATRTDGFFRLGINR